MHSIASYSNSSVGRKAVNRYEERFGMDDNTFLISLFLLSFSLIYSSPSPAQHPYRIYPGIMANFSKGFRDSSHIHIHNTQMGGNL